MRHQSHTDATNSTAGTRMPGGVRGVVLGAVGLLLAGALYLIAVRGEALLVDLAKLGAIFCM